MTPTSLLVPPKSSRPSHYGKWGQRGWFPRQRVPARHCQWCGDPIPEGSRRRSYCGATCADEMTLRIVWGVLRGRIIERDQLCQLCGGVSYVPNSHDVWLWERLFDTRTGEIRQSGILTQYGDAGPAIRIDAEWHVDHILPCADGGTDDPENLRLLCGRCHKRITAEWRRARAA